jgi:hypothetical protein
VVIGLARKKLVDRWTLFATLALGNKLQITDGRNAGVVEQLDRDLPAIREPAR